MAKPQGLPAVPVLKFKYEKNASIDLGDGRQYIIPCEQKFMPSQFSRGRQGEEQSDPLKMKMVPVFDLSIIHEIPLHEERPLIPKKQTGMSDQYHQKLADAAYERASKAKDFNDKVRARVYSYVETGMLSIVHDPFDDESDVYEASGRSLVNEDSDTTPEESEVVDPKPAEEPKPKPKK